MCATHRPFRILQRVVNLDERSVPFSPSFSRLPRHHIFDLIRCSVRGGGCSRCEVKHLLRYYYGGGAVQVQVQGDDEKRQSRRRSLFAVNAITVYGIRTSPSTKEERVCRSANPFGFEFRSTSGTSGTSGTSSTSLNDWQKCYEVRYLETVC